MFSQKGEHTNAILIPSHTQIDNRGSLKYQGGKNGRLLMDPIRYFPCPLAFARAQLRHNNLLQSNYEGMESASIGRAQEKIAWVESVRVDFDCDFP